MATIITPNTRGHYPAGYPKSANGYSGDARELEQAQDTPDLQIFKTALEESQSDANSYFRRNQNALDWMQARWPGQTIDGRKWAFNGSEPWPWPGASDTRVRLVEKIFGHHLTLWTYAQRNMKVQAKANRPFGPISGGQRSDVGRQMGMGGFGGQMSDVGRQMSGNQMSESQKATTLLNWMLFTHMGAELHREQNLGLAWRGIYGSALIKACWKQTRRLNYIDVSVPGLQDFINEPSVASFLAGDAGNIPIGENLSITDLQEMIMDPAYADDLAVLLREVSQKFLSIKEARKKLDDLRQLRTVEIPIPDTFESRPQIIARRPMVDVFFPAAADDLQIQPWIAEVELVSETTLRDRIATHKYDKGFVEDALDRRGPSSGSLSNDWSVRTAAERNTMAGYNRSLEIENKIELVHFYSLVQDRGVPVRFYTVFHMDIEQSALHEPYGYDHQEACHHPLRFEILDRPILSSRGIPEIAYTWEQEIKVLRDMRTDRAAMSLRPPIFTTYEEMAKLKASYMPGSFIPMRRFDSIEKDKPPVYDPAIVTIEQEVEARVREHFGIFGNDLDPALKRLRQEQLVDDLLTEYKPVYQQMMKLMRQLLPDADVAAVVGQLSRPFHIDRRDLQMEFEITGTVDLRDADSDWAKERFSVVPQILQLDTQGQINRTPILKSLLGWLSPDLVESSLPDDTQQVTQAEIQNEQEACDRIMGSGRDQPVPQGANYQLRLQTLRAYLQQIPQNPVMQKKMQENPELMQVFITRQKGYEFQLQQQQNAMIGRLGTPQTFTKQAPQIAAPSESMAGY